MPPFARHIVELSRLAAERDHDMIAYVDSIKEDLAAMCSKDELRSLDEAVETLNFEKAMEIVNRFAETQGIMLESLTLEREKECE